MRLRVTTFYKIVIYFLTFINSGFFFIQQIKEFDVILTCFLTILLMIVYIYKHYQSKQYFYGKETRNYIFGIFVFLTLELMRTFVSPSFERPSIKFSIMLIISFTELLLAFPIMEILIKDHMMTFIRNVVFIDFMATLFRFFIWFLYNYKGITLFSSIFNERGIDWSRNGVVRLAATPLNGLTYVTFVYLLLFSKRGSMKLFGVLGLTISFLYSWLVYNSRSQIICYSVVLFFSYVISISQSKKTAINKLFLLSPLIIIAFIGLNYIKIFFNTFSVTGEMGYSTIARVNEFLLFYKSFSSSLIEILFGMGISSDLHTIGIVSYYLSDLGMLGFLFNYGVVGLVLFFGRFFMKLFNYLHLKIISDNRIYLIPVGLILYTLLSSIFSQDMFDPVRLYITPFILALIEKIDYSLKT